MRLTQANPRRGGIMLFVAIGILLFVALYMSAGGGRTSRKAIAGNQQFHPEAAFWYYTRSMKAFTTDQAKFEQVFLAVTNADKDWFYANYQNLKSDPANLSSGIDPAQAEAMARIDAMRSLAMAGPMEGVEIVERQEGETEAHYKVKWTLNSGSDLSHFNGEVVIVLESGKWKVRDFAGARQKLEQGGV